MLLGIETHYSALTLQRLFDCLKFTQSFTCLAPGPGLGCLKNKPVNVINLVEVFRPTSISVINIYILRGNIYIFISMYMGTYIFRSKTVPHLHSFSIVHSVVIFLATI